MSVKVMAWVWEWSQSKKSDRLVLLAIADCASEDGANAYPSITELIRKTGLSERGVQSAIARLVELGELFVGRNLGPRGCNRYRVVMTLPTDPVGGSACTPAESAPPQNLHPPATSAPPPPQPVHPTPATSAPGTVLEPSIEPSKRRTSSRVDLASREDVERVCRHLADRIEANGSLRPTIGKEWHTSARLMMDKDGRTEQQIHRAIDWCQDDPFWRGNILCMSSLRKKYDQLRLKAQQQRTRSAPPSAADTRIAALQALKRPAPKAVTA